MLGQMAIVSGGARGIGFATVTQFAQKGYRVIAVDRNPNVIDRAAELTAAGHAVSGRVADVTRWSEIQAALATETSINVLVCAAGILISKRIEDHADEDFRLTFDVNVHGYFMLAQEALKKMGEGSHIVMVAS